MQGLVLWIFALLKCDLDNNKYFPYICIRFKWETMRTLCGANGGIRMFIMILCVRIWLARLIAKLSHSPFFNAMPIKSDGKSGSHVIILWSFQSHTKYAQKREIYEESLEQLRNRPLLIEPRAMVFCRHTCGKWLNFGKRGEMSVMNVWFRDFLPLIW